MMRHNLSGSFLTCMDVMKFQLDRIMESRIILNPTTKISAL
jgi:hypothetical protein